MPIRNLGVTEQSWETYFDDLQNQTFRIYNTPLTTGQTLDCNQGKGQVAINLSETYDVSGYNIDPNFKMDFAFHGTCGIVSCVNLLRLAGRSETTEQEVLEYAWNHELCYGHNIEIKNNRIFYIPGYFGGTTPYMRKFILSHFGLPSNTVVVNPDADLAIADIAGFVSEGRGVILSVHASVLWGEVEEADPHAKDHHAITVTSVQMDSDNQITGFYICDSGTHKDDYARFCSADLIKRSLTGTHMNVTDIIIR